MASSTYRIAESASESLYEDEHLRSNLTDAEAEIVLRWASDWLTDQISTAPDEDTAKRVAQDAGARVRAALAAFNKAFKKQGNTPLSTLVSAVEPILSGSTPFSPEEALTLVTGLATTAWKLR